MLGFDRTVVLLELVDTLRLTDANRGRLYLDLIALLPSFGRRRLDGFRFPSPLPIRPIPSHRSLF